jgi:hypothetical protein
MFADKRCAIHPSIAALSFCRCCKQFFCEHCLTEAGDYYFCSRPECVAAGQEEIKRKQNTIRAAYAVGFCDSCIDATEPTSGGKLFVTVNGIGVRLLGRRRRCPHCNSVVAVAWFCFCFIPIFPLARYRIAWLRGNSLLTRWLKRS